MTDQQTPEHEGGDTILAAEHVLGLLGAAEHQAVDTRLRTDATLRAEVAGWAETFVNLTETVPEVAPPVEIRATLERKLFPAPERGSLVARLARGLGATALLAAAALAVVLFVDPFGGDELSPATLIAQIEGEESGLRLIAGYHPDERVMVVRREAGAVPEGRVLELWLIEGENAPVSMGVLPDVEQSQFVVEASLVERLPGAVLAISDEPPGGSPTGAPTGNVLGVGPMTDL